MRIRLIFILAFFTLTCQGQEKIQGYIGLSQQWVNDFSYTSSKLEAGPSFSIGKGALTIFASYQYYGNLSTQNLSYEDVKAFRFTSQLLGGGINYRINDLSKFYSPVFGFSIVTEISSNYSGKRLGIRNYNEKGEFFFIPTEKIGKIYSTSGENILFHNTYTYLSTPIIANFFFDNRFKISHGLFINLGIGFSIEKRSVHYKEWSPNEKEPETNLGNLNPSEDIHGEIKIINNLNFCFGINYTFPFKLKNEKQ